MTNQRLPIIRPWTNIPSTAVPTDAETLVWALGQISEAERLGMFDGSWASSKQTRDAIMARTVAGYGDGSLGNYHPEHWSKAT